MSNSTLSTKAQKSVKNSKPEFSDQSIPGTSEWTVRLGKSTLCAFESQHACANPSFDSGAQLTHNVKINPEQTERAKIGQKFKTLAYFYRWKSAS